MKILLKYTKYPEIEGEIIINFWGESSPIDKVGEAERSIRKVIENGITKYRHGEVEILNPKEI